MLHFGCEDKSSEFLKPEYLEKLSSGFGAARVLLSSNETVSQEECSEASSSSHSVPKNFMESKATGKPTGTVPKWFKPNK